MAQQEKLWESCLKGDCDAVAQLLANEDINLETPDAVSSFIFF
jgi:hypothetical protein